jgi:hypothetical protein
VIGGEREFNSTINSQTRLKGKQSTQSMTSRVSSTRHRGQTPRSSMGFHENVARTYVGELLSKVNVEDQAAGYY